MKRKEYLKSLLTQAMKEVEEEAKKAGAKFKQEEKRKSIKEEQELNESTLKPKFFSIKDLSISVRKEASFLKTDKIKRKVEKQPKKRKKSSESPVKECKIQEQELEHVSQCFGYSSTPSGDHSEQGQAQFSWFSWFSSMLKE